MSQIDPRRQSRSRFEPYLNPLAALPVGAQHLPVRNKRSKPAKARLRRHALAYSQRLFLNAFKERPLLADLRRMTIGYMRPELDVQAGG